MQSSTTEYALGAVRVTPTALVELEWDGTPALTIERADIRSVRLVRGVTVERPVLVFAFGALLVCAGVLTGVALARALMAGASRLKWGAAVSIVIPGAWAMRHATRRGLYLDVVLESDRRKIVFAPEVTEEAALELMAALRRDATWERVVH